MVFVIMAMKHQFHNKKFPSFFLNEALCHKSYTAVYNNNVGRKYVVVGTGIV